MGALFAPIHAKKDSLIILRCDRIISCRAHTANGATRHLRSDKRVKFGTLLNSVMASIVHASDIIYNLPLGQFGTQAFPTLLALLPVLKPLF